MALSSRTRYSLVAFFLFVVVAVVLLVWNQRDTDEVTGEESPISQGEVTPESEDIEGAAEEVAEEASPETMEPAKRIVHVQSESVQADDDIQLVANPYYISSDAVVAESVKYLELALNGDIEAAQFIHDVRGLCRQVPQGEASIQALLLAREGKYEQMSAMGVRQRSDGSLGAGAGATYPTDEQQKKHYEKWGQACDQLKETISALFHGELVSLAEDGHVVARYLYAILEPSFAPTVDSFAARQDWQLNALRYTYENLQNGEPLGMLAFAASYENHLFTGQDRALGLALKMAAVDCGLALPKVRQIIEAASQWPDDSPYWAFMNGATPADVRLMAQGFHEEYCQ